MSGTSQQLEATAGRSIYIRGAVAGAFVALGWGLNLLLLSLDSAMDGSLFAGTANTLEGIAWNVITLGTTTALGLMLAPLFRSSRVLACVIQGFVLGAAIGSFTVPFLWLAPDAIHFLRTGHWLYLGSDGWGRGAVALGTLAMTAYGALGGAIFGALVWPFLRRARKPLACEPLNAP